METVEVLKNISNKGYLFNQLHFLDYDKDSVAIANIIYVLFIYNSEGKDEKPYVNSTSGVNKYFEILKNPNKYEKIVEAFSDMVFNLKENSFLFNTYNNFEKNSKNLLSTHFIISVLNRTHFTFLRQKI